MNSNKIYFGLIVFALAMGFTFQNCAPNKIVSSMQCQMNGIITKDETVDLMKEKNPDGECPSLSTYLGLDDMTDEDLLKKLPVANAHSDFTSVTLLDQKITGNDKYPSVTKKSFKELFNYKNFQMACEMNIQKEGCPNEAAINATDFDKYVILRVSARGNDSNLKTVPKRKFRVFIPPGTFFVRSYYLPVNTAVAGVVNVKFGDSKMTVLSNQDIEQMRNIADRKGELENLFLKMKEVQGEFSSQTIQTAPFADSHTILSKGVKKGGWLYVEPTRVFQLKEAADIKAFADPFNKGVDVTQDPGLKEVFSDVKYEIFVVKDVYTRWYDLMNSKKLWDASGEPLDSL